MSMRLTAARARLRRAVPSTLLADPRYEVLPLAGVREQVATLPPGTAVTVTSSPSRGTMATVELAEKFAEWGMRAVPHLSARGMRDDAELVEVLQRMDHAGIRDAFIVGGDATNSTGAFADGEELLQAIHEIGHRLDHIGIPSYPEGHPSIDNETLWAALKAKEQYATYTVTQLCFDADTIASFVVAARNQGINLPIIAGIPGVVDPSKLLRVSMRIGIGDSLRFVRGNRSAVRKMLWPGGFRPDSLVRRLDARTQAAGHELAGLHVYTFNHVETTARRLRQMSRRALTARR